MNASPQPAQPAAATNRRQLPADESAERLQDLLARHFPATATLAFQLREVVRTQLLTATEEFMLRPTELFLGYSVHTYTQDPIAGLTVAANEVKLVFAHPPTTGGDSLSIAGQRPGLGELRLMQASPDDLMILKVLLREAARTSRPRLLSGRNGHSFIVGDA